LKDFTPLVRVKQTRSVRDECSDELPRSTILLGRTCV
jgi:hypothetical protein